MISTVSDGEGFYCILFCSDCGGRGGGLLSVLKCWNGEGDEPKAGYAYEKYFKNINV